MAEALIPVYEGRLSRLPGLMAQMTTDHSGYAWVRLRGGLHVGFHWKVEAPGRKRPVWRLCRFGAPVSDVELGTFRRHVVLPDSLYSAVPDVKPGGWPRNFTLIGPSQQDGATG